MSRHRNGLVSTVPPASVWNMRRRTFEVSQELTRVAHELDFFVDFHALRQRIPNVFGSGNVVFAM
jgi:hypothetical protein